MQRIKTIKDGKVLGLKKFKIFLGKYTKAKLRSCGYTCIEIKKMVEEGKIKRISVGGVDYYDCKEFLNQTT